MQLNTTTQTLFPSHLASGGPRDKGQRTGLVIKVNQTENPKKRAAADRFSKYRNGMTPGEYAEAIGGNRTQAYRDIVWDTEHDYIELVPMEVVKK